MGIQRKYLQDGLSGCGWIISSMIAVYCAVAWGGDHGQLVRPAQPISFAVVPAEEPNERLERDPLNDAKVAAVHARLSSSPSGKPEPENPSLVAPAEPLRLAVTEPTPPAFPSVSNPPQIDAADPTPALAAEALMAEVLQEAATVAAWPPVTALKRTERLPESYRRGEIDRLARRKPAARVESINSGRVEADDTCRSAVLGFLADVTGQRQTAEVFEVTMVQLSQVPELLSAQETPGLDREVIAEGAIGLDQATEPPPTIEQQDDGLVAIAQTTTNIQPLDGMLPEDYASPHFDEVDTQRTSDGYSRDWPLYAFWWEAPASSHGPLYFEQPNLERYGYSKGLAQPLLSGAHFFATIPALPYLMAANPPHESIYTLGHYRPGSCAPYQVHYPPLSLKGALAEGGVLTGLIFLIP